MIDCIFCAIIEGKSPASVVYADSDVIAFMDIRPVTPGHTLVIPKKHATYLGELDEDTGSLLFTVAARIARAVRVSGVKSEGVNLFLADGEAAGQEIFHVHLHVIPRFKGDSFVVKCDSADKPTRRELDGIAERIKSGMLK